MILLVQQCLTGKVGDLLKDDESKYIMRARLISGIMITPLLVIGLLVMNFFKLGDINVFWDCD